MIDLGVARARERCREDLHAFVRAAWRNVETDRFEDNWHIELICRYLEAVTRGQITKLVINVPPGSSKSTLVNLFWPAWEWLEYPERRWFHVSNDVTLVSRDAQKLRKLITSEWYLRLSGGSSLIDLRSPVLNFTTKLGGRRFSTSFHGRAIGWHANRFVYDDPVKLEAAWSKTNENLLQSWHAIKNVFGTRHLPGATDVIVMQRIAEHDPSGLAIDEGWTKLVLPMRCDYEIRHTANPIVPGDFDDPRNPGSGARDGDGETLAPRFTEAFLASLNVTPDEWDTQFQQRPGRKSGSIIVDEWITNHTVSLDEIKNLQGIRIQSWDLAFKKSETTDFVAGQWWARADVEGEAHFFLCAEPTNARLSFVDTAKEMIEKRKLWPSTRIIVEDKANGPAIEDTLKRVFTNMHLVNPQGSKTARLHSVAARFANGHVHFVRGPHLDRMVKTFKQFPNVKHDDEVDACTQALLDLGARAPFARVASSIRDFIEGRGD